MLEFIKSIKRRHIIKQLAREPREKKIENLEQIQSIGIIFTLGEESDWNLLYHFAQVMEEKNKKVAMIGLHPDGNSINFIVTHPQTIICREKDDLNFWGIPRDGVIDRFTDIHFDVVIDTTDQPNFFGQYVALRSNADIKITHTDEVDMTMDENIFDVMIKGEGPVNLRDYLNNVVQYLCMVKK